MRAFAALIALTSFASADQMFRSSKGEIVSLADQLGVESMINNVPQTPKFSENFYFTVGEWTCTRGFGPLKFEVKNNSFWETKMGKGQIRELRPHLLQDMTQPDLLWELHADNYGLVTQWWHGNIESECQRNN